MKGLGVYAGCFITSVTTWVFSDGNLAMALGFWFRFMKENTHVTHVDDGVDMRFRLETKYLQIRYMRCSYEATCTSW
jgi:hypothetical protein